MQIEPTGYAADNAAATNAVVASCVVFVPAAAVGAVGVPVNPALLISALDAIALEIAVSSMSISVPFTILPALPVGKESLAVKLVAFEQSATMYSFY